MRSQLFAPLAGILKPPLMNIGSFNGRSMDFGAARGIGMTKLMPSSCRLSSTHHLKTCVSVQDSYPLSVITSALLSLGLYINNFVYFSKDPEVETLFCHLLVKHCKVDFMGIVEWFLGVHFLWCVTPSSVAIHLNQSVLPQILLRALLAKPAMRLRRPPCIDPEFLLIPSCHLSMLMTLLRRSDRRTLIKVSSAVLVSFIYYMP
jgi:hypothetical protein